MTRFSNRDKAQPPTDGVIVAVKSDRRSFLTRAVGTAGAFALAALAAGACNGGGSSDPPCDADDGTDTDPRNSDTFDPLGDPVGQGRRDRCDAD